MQTRHFYSASFCSPRSQCAVIVRCCCCCCSSTRLDAALTSEDGVNEKKREAANKKPSKYEMESEKLIMRDYILLCCDSVIVVLASSRTRVREMHISLRRANRLELLHAELEDDGDTADGSCGNAYKKREHSKRSPNDNIGEERSKENVEI